MHLELRAGTGGDESALFVEDMFKMYLRFVERQRWRMDISPRPKVQQVVIKS